MRKLNAQNINSYILIIKCWEFNTGLVSLIQKKKKKREDKIEIEIEIFGV